MMTAEKPMKQMKEDERHYAVQDAVRTLKDYAKVRKQKELFGAARDALKQEIADSQALLKQK